MCDRLALLNDLDFLVLRARSDKRPFSDAKRLSCLCGLVDLAFACVFRTPL